MIFFGLLSLVFGFIISDFQFVIFGFLIFTFILLVLTLPRPQIDLDKSISKTTMFENGEVRVKLDINRAKPGHGYMEIYDHIPVYTQLHAGFNMMIYNPEQYNTLEYHVKFPLRGYYSIGPTKLRITDHFNYFYSDYIPLEKEPISIYPHMTEMKDFKFKSKKNIHYPGEFLTPQAGSSTDFYHIRDYMKGDPFKKINWKVYARKRELMINEFEKENVCDAMMFIDARAISNIGTMKENTLEYNIKLALALSHYLILRRNQVGLVVYNDRVQVLPPKMGLGHFNEILSFVTGVYARGWMDINAALYYAKSYLKTKTTIIIISNLDYDQSFLNSMQYLAASDYKIIIISPSPVDFEIRAAQFSGPMEKVDLFKMSRENFIIELRNMGITVIDYKPEEDMESVIDNISKEIMR
jgi:uncharacterized protein (DUF58 family)